MKNRYFEEQIHWVPLKKAHLIAAFTSGCLDLPSPPPPSPPSPFTTLSSTRQDRDRHINCSRLNFLTMKWIQLDSRKLNWGRGGSSFRDHINVALERRSVDKVGKESWSRRLNRILLSLTFRVIFLACYMCAKINIHVALFVISVCSNDKLPWPEVIWLAESLVGLSRVPDWYKCANKIKQMWNKI